MCRSGQCMQKHLRCDGKKQCPDGDDEENCPTSNEKNKLTLNLKKKNRFFHIIRLQWISM